MQNQRQTKSTEDDETIGNARDNIFEAIYVEKKTNIAIFLFG